MSQTVVGLFSKSSDAQEAVQQLINNGFSSTNIDLSTGKETGNSSNTDFKLESTGHESGIKKFFKNLFTDEDEADRYSTIAAGSGAIVTVHASSADEAHIAADILDEYGAENVDEQDGSTDYGRTEKFGTGAVDSTQDTTLGASQSIPIIEEELQVGKRTVQTGGVRLRSRIVERPVEETLRLRNEYVRVERNTVSRPATEADFNSFKEGEIEMIETAEVPVVSKDARVVEEVSLGKNVDNRNETVRDTVRKTEVDIENIDAPTTSKEGKRSNN